MIKKIIKKIIPKKLILSYHWFLSKLASLYYNNPSKKLIVIGVTGTNGKTTTVNIISQLLKCLGNKVGFASTVNFNTGDKEWLNDKKMTMLGRFQTQKLLKQMVKNNCKYVVIETSSQGIEQFRHSGINYDVVVFTNLTPEHIEAHGSFENYRDAKEKLFKHLSNGKKKKIGGKKINKVIISNSDDKETERLKKYKIDKFITYSFINNSDYKGNNLKLENGLVSFSLGNNHVNTEFLGKFNGYNILSSIVTLISLGFSIKETSNCKLKPIQGRQEFINEGQNFKILIDYAPEPESIKQLYSALKDINKNNIIHVLGSCGGGRDVARQPILGELAGKLADIVIITNEDPYDDNPIEIIDNIANGAIKKGKILNNNLFKIENRESAIKKALELANQDDLVLITGKGSEQAICVANGKKIEWDDRKITKKLLKNIKTVDNV